MLKPKRNTHPVSSHFSETPPVPREVLIRTIFHDKHKGREINYTIFSSHMSNPANHSCCHHSQTSLLLWQCPFVNWLTIPTEAGCSHPMPPKQLYPMPLWTFLPSKSPGLKTMSISDIARNSGLVGLVSQNMEHWHSWVKSCYWLNSLVQPSRTETVKSLQRHPENFLSFITSPGGYHHSQWLSLMTPRNLPAILNLITNLPSRDQQVKITDQASPDHT